MDLFSVGGSVITKLSLDAKLPAVPTKNDARRTRGSAYARPERPVRGGQRGQLPIQVFEPTMEIGRRFTARGVSTGAQGRYQHR